MKLCVAVLPLLLTMSVGGHFVGMYELDQKFKNEFCSLALCLAYTCGCFGVTFLWICGLIAFALVLEISAWLYPAGTLHFLGAERFSQNKSSLDFWFSLIDWIDSARKHHVGSSYAGCTSFTKQQDRTMRLCSVNHVLLETREFACDEALLEYLSAQKKQSQYMGVKWSALRSNTRDTKLSQFLRKFWYGFYGGLWDDFNKEWKDSQTSTTQSSTKWAFIAMLTGLVTFMFGPIYFASRCMTVAFPFFIALYLHFAYDVNIWATSLVDTFQVVMFSVYMTLSCILCVLCYVNCTEQHLMWHILPSKTWLTTRSATRSREATPTQEITKRITDHYYGIIVIPIRRAMVIDHFGHDLGSIILSFLPLDDVYSHADNEVVKLTSVI